MSEDHADAKRDDSIYEMLLNAIPSSVLLVGRDLRITLANRNFLERSRRTGKRRWIGDCRKSFRPRFWITRRLSGAFKAFLTPTSQPPAKESPTARRAD